MTDKAVAHAQDLWIAAGWSGTRPRRLLENGAPTMKYLLLFIALAGCGTVSEEHSGPPDSGAASAAGSDAAAPGGAGGAVVATGGLGSSDGSTGAGGAPSTGVDAGTDAPNPWPIALVDSTTSAAAWAFSPPSNGTGSYLVTPDNNLCAMLTGTMDGAVGTIGWPADGNGVSLHSGTTYELEYTASATAPLLSFLAKVGGVMAPYSTDFQYADTVSATAQHIVHTFVAGADDANAGIAFVFSASTTAATTVCVSSVALRIH